MRRIVGALVLALVISGLSTWALSRKLTKPVDTAAVVKVRYVAPSRALEADEILSQQNTELVDWPGDAALAGGFKNIADVVGRVVLFPLAKGQPVLDRDLSAPGAGAGLAGKIPNGMRAVALRSDEIVGVAGFLAPGSHLDVLVTYSPDHVADPLTATVLENALVIAAGHQIEPDASGKIPDATVVTLLLTPEQAQRAVLASTQGAIHFVLRNGGDASTSAEMPVKLSQLAGHPTIVQGTAPVRAVKPAPVAKPREIETILAGVAEVRSNPRPSGGAGL
ncbi:MAG TPA: Flp pilus assembly protein CpaB [Acidobacteriaceae bacterium]|nr:Flp pilus assembly protein CpaB [Acidobacteriaceae bacterium]